MNPRYKSLSMIILYMSGLSSLSPPLSLSLHPGGSGIFVVLQFSKPASDIRYNMYFCYEINILSCDLAISSPRKYLTGPNFLIVKALFREFLTSSISTRDGPIIKISSTYTSTAKSSLSRFW